MINMEVYFVFCLSGYRGVACFPNVFQVSDSNGTEEERSTQVSKGTHPIHKISHRIIFYSCESTAFIYFHNDKAPAVTLCFQSSLNPVPSWDKVSRDDKLHRHEEVSGTLTQARWEVIGWNKGSIGLINGKVKVINTSWVSGFWESNCC